MNPELNYYGHCVALLIFLSCSAFFSAAETSYFSLSRLQVERIQQGTGFILRWIKYFLNRPRQLLITVVAGNELMNFALAVIMTEILHTVLKPYNLGQLTAVLNAFILVPVVILVAEVTPKVIALKSNEKAVKILTGPLLLFYVLLRPIRSILFFITRLILRIVHVPAAKESALTENEFFTLIHQSTEEGHIEFKHREFIMNVFGFSKFKGAEIMQPIDECFMLPSFTSLESATGLIYEAGFSRVPIYEENREKVVGIVYARDILRVKAMDPSHFGRLILKNIMRPAFYVGSRWDVNRILQEMKRHRRQIAIVYDEKSGVRTNKTALGIIAMEDIIEKFFGRIEDEKDIEKEEAAE